MISFQVESIVQVPFHVVADNFSEDLFSALAPAFPPSSLISFDGDRIGGLVKVRIGIPPLSQLWISEITSRSQSSEEVEFVDKGIQLPWPLSEWEHRHVIRQISEKETMIIDDITCSSGSSLMDKALAPFLKGMFQKRTPIYRRYFLELTQKGA